MPTDIIIYAVVAAVMVFWLRSVLGTRNEDEKERPNPFDEKQAPQSAPNAATMPPIDMEPSDMSVGDDKVDAGLVQIALADKAFNLKEFKENVEDAFMIIVTAFADGDRDTLRDMCTADVYEAFDTAIIKREKSGKHIVTEIHAVRKLDVVDAGVDKKMAHVAMRITADETYVVQDADGEILAGHPDRVSEMTDKWTFSRDTKSADPRWFLSKTEDDVVEEEHGKTPVPDAG